MSRNPLVFMAALVITEPLYHISLPLQILAVCLLLFLWARLFN